MTTGFLYDPAFLAHDTGPGHPECPARLTASLAHLKARPWFAALHQVTARQAEREALLAIHDEHYLTRAEATCLSGGRTLDSADVTVGRTSYTAAILAAGGALALADALLKGQIRNGFALLRPPGHHAERTHAMGFCLLNNIAILARYLQRAHGLPRIAIFDFDVHHGNGTQHSFEDDPTVLYISIHQYPFYPGTGAATETGVGSGVGATLNCPLPAGATDADYERVMRLQVLPKLASFRPDIVLLSAGFDAHCEDPLGQMELSTAFYGWLTAEILAFADQHCAGRLLSLLEGGYHLAYLPDCVSWHLATLAGQRAP
jgi:acetoin utilization deacetylase AcuC-like enzyme